MVLVFCSRRTNDRQTSTTYIIQVRNLEDQLIGEATLNENERSQDLYLIHFRNLYPRRYPGLMAEVLALALEHIPVETIALDATNLRGIEGSDSALYEYYLRIGFIHDRFGNYNSFYQSSQEIIARNSLHRYPLEWLWAIEH